MAIINDFPIGSTELAAIYDDTSIFPAFLGGGSAVEFNSNYVYCSSSSDTETRYAHTLTFHPARSFYIKLSISTEDVIIQCDPGHVYSINHLACDVSEQAQGHYYVYKDGVMIYEKTALPNFGMLFTKRIFIWSYTNA